MQTIPDFRLVFTLVAHMEGYECPATEGVDHALMELMLEVQGALNEKLAEINKEHDLSLGVIDFQIRTVPGRDEMSVYQNDDLEEEVA